MIKEQTQNNIPLTVEQQKQKDLFDTRMAYLQIEISNAQKILSSTKNDTARIIKEKEYQSDLLAKVTESLSETQSRVNQLNDVFNSTTSDLHKLQQEIASADSIHVEKTMQLKDREAEVEKKEKESMEIVNQLISKKQELNTELEIFNKKVSSLKEVISQF